MLDEDGDAIVEVLRAIIVSPAGAIALRAKASQSEAVLVVALILSALGGHSDDVERPGFPSPTLMRDMEAHLHATYGTACDFPKAHGFMRDDVDALRARLVEGIRVRAGAFVRQDGRLASVGRRRDGQSYSVTPGGGVEPGETCAAAAVREVREELGITCTLREPAALRLDDNAYEPRWADPLTIDDLRPDDVATYVRAHTPGGRDGADDPPHPRPRRAGRRVRRRRGCRVPVDGRRGLAL